MLVTAPAGSPLYAQDAMRDLFRPRLGAFAVCDLAAAGITPNRVADALRRYGGRRWNQS